MSQSTIELDQDDITARLAADSLFANTVKVLERRKGVTESDVTAALGAVNQQGQKTGLVAIVLIPQIVPYAPNSPGPQYYARYRVQVIDYPVIRATNVVGGGAGGAGITAETLTERIRMVLHNWNPGRGQTLVFDGLVEAPMANEKQVGYILSFRRQGIDPNPGKVATVLISATGSTAGSTVTLTCATAGTTIYYTVDGTYPDKTKTQYTAPFAAPAGTVRAAAFDNAAALIQGDCAQSIFT